jgi:hypothetical protein
MQMKRRQFPVSPAFTMEQTGMNEKYTISLACSSWATQTYDGL